MIAAPMKTLQLHYPMIQFDRQRILKPKTVHRLFANKRPKKGQLTADTWPTEDQYVLKPTWRQIY